jgi:hypothetical protein
MRTCSFQPTWGRTTRAQRIDAKRAGRREKLQTPRGKEVPPARYCRQVTREGSLEVAACGARSLTSWRAAPTAGGSSRLMPVQGTPEPSPQPRSPGAPAGSKQRGPHVWLPQASPGRRSAPASCPDPRMPPRHRLTATPGPCYRLQESGTRWDDARVNGTKKDEATLSQERPARTNLKKQPQLQLRPPFQRDQRKPDVLARALEGKSLPEVVTSPQRHLSAGGRAA